MLIRRVCRYDAHNAVRGQDVEHAVRPGPHIADPGGDLTENGFLASQLAGRKIQPPDFPVHQRPDEQAAFPGGKDVRLVNGL